MAWQMLKNGEETRVAPKPPAAALRSRQLDAGASARGACLALPGCAIPHMFGTQIL
jgi:hypothetical protein